MNITFTDKELQVIQIIVPDLTPEQTCNKVLRDWFNANVARTQAQIQPLSTDEMVDNILTANTDQAQVASAPVLE